MDHMSSEESIAFIIAALLFFNKSFLLFSHAAVSMSRHNRRRTRGGHKASLQRNGFDLPSTDEPPEPGLSSSPWHATRRGKPYKRQRNNTFLAQLRARRQEEDTTKLVRRIFGESHGEEDNDLCVRMIDYFDGCCLAFLD